MQTMGSWALRTACALFLLLHLVGGSNSTATDTTPKYTGWQKGPAERGTMTILWSCLTTVFACTWTILHLNVPGRADGTWRKILRKTKWMVITVVFPEFIFAKAVCELQMAVEDLHELKEQEESFGWEVEYGRGCRLLYWLFNSRKSSSSQPLPAVAASGIKEVNIEFERSKKWTLTHSYFANMGGIARKRDGVFPSYKLVTAHGLARCCVPNKHSLPEDIRITEEEILDKSKADNLLKTVAALQILWLIVSVITRKWYSLPISLLEVCTVAFAALAVATYGANLAKPKEVDVPITLISENFYEDGHEDEFYRNGEPFFARTVRPTIHHSPRNMEIRIANDLLRLQSHGTQYVTLTYALAVSTMCFGAIHCAAWQSYFPSQVERRLWQVASVLSSTLPLSNLLVLFVFNAVTGRKANKVIKIMESLMESPTISPVEGLSETTREPDSSTGLKRVRLSYIDDELCTDANPSSLWLRMCLQALFEVRNGVGKGEASRSWCAKYLRGWKGLSKSSSKTVYELVVALDDASRVRGVRVFPAFYGELSQRSPPEEMMPLLIETINNSRETTTKLCNQWYGLTTRLDRMSTILAWLSGLLYITARLILLAVAFAAFRKQNEDLYIDTWARFMPGWR